MLFIAAMRRIAPTYSVAVQLSWIFQVLHPSLYGHICISSWKTFPTCPKTVWRSCSGRSSCDSCSRGSHPLTKIAVDCISWNCRTCWNCTQVGKRTRKASRCRRFSDLIPKLITKNLLTSLCPHLTSFISIDIDCGAVSVFKAVSIAKIRSSISSFRLSLSQGIKGQIKSVRQDICTWLRPPYALHGKKFPLGFGSWQRRGILRVIQRSKSFNPG